jgi:uncharacterized protein YcfJ
VQTGAGGGVSAAPTLIGAVTGGLLGAAIGNHHNQAAGTAIGTVFGGAVGYDIARRNATPTYTTYGTQEVCTTVQDVHEEERINGYQVRYEYLGQIYQTVMPYAPGRTVRVRVDVTPAF